MLEVVSLIYNLKCKTMSYKRKTEDEYVIIGYYSTGREELCVETNRKDLKENLRLYRENEPGTRFTYIKRRVKIQN